MLKKSLIILITIILMLGMCSNVYATDLKTSLDIIQKASETKYLENDQGYISKNIVDSNKDTGEVTVELKLSNTKKEEEKISETEIFLVVDNSPSMDFMTPTGKTRKELVLNSASQLVNAIYNASAKIKIGLVDFHGGSNSIYNATVRQRLTDNKDTVQSAIKGQLNRSTVGGTNIEAGLKVAQNNFSTDVNNKIIILLTDGIPNYSLSSNASNDVTTESAIKVGEDTKKALNNLKANGIYTITLLTGINATDGNTDKDGYVYEKENTLEEELEAARKIFGTPTQPTADKYYLVSSININDVITKDILRDVTNKIQNPINTVKIVDYFPEDITENFEFSYVGKPNVGTVTEKIDANNKIEWNIDTLKGDQVATLKYKLKIKDMKNANILNKTISTNEKVVLTYKDTNAKEHTVTLASSPKIQLSEIKEKLVANVSYNPTETTTGNVTATIKTNKKVNKVEGWNLSEDGKTLTKSYEKNTTEKVHLTDIDGMTKDVEIKITNIKQPENKQPINNQPDNTTAIGNLPQTGVSITIVIGIIAITLISIAMYKKYNSYKDIK